MEREAATIVIVGMHRSGTSLTARWLNECGLILGENLMAGGVGNPDGHYEDMDFHDFHEKVFNSLDILYGGLALTPEIKLNDSFRDELKLLVDEKNKINTHWGWKEPRTCLFLNYYNDYLENPCYLILYRSANQVVNSLWKRYAESNDIQLSLNELREEIHKDTVAGFIDAYIEYNEAILKFVETLDQDQYRVQKSLDLISSDEDIISWLNDFGFQLNPVRFNSIFDSSKYSEEEVELPYSPAQQKRVLLIQRQFDSYVQKEMNFDDLHGIKDELLKAVKEQAYTLTKKNKELTIECQRLNGVISMKDQVIASAVKWQESWKKRVFHKWRVERVIEK